MSANPEYDAHMTELAKVIAVEVGLTPEEGVELYQAQVDQGAEISAPVKKLLESKGITVEEFKRSVTERA